MTAPQTAPQTPISTKVGVGLMAAELLWWFAYHANYRGAFGLTDLKLMCITGATLECEGFQQSIGSVAIPAYNALLWWAGVIVYAGGWLARRFGGASS